MNDCKSRTTGIAVLVSRKGNQVRLTGQACMRPQGPFMAMGRFGLVDFLCQCLAP